MATENRFRVALDTVASVGTARIVEASRTTITWRYVRVSAVDWRALLRPTIRFPILSKEHQKSIIH